MRKIRSPFDADERDNHNPQPVHLNPQQVHPDPQPVHLNPQPVHLNPQPVNQYHGPQPSPSPSPSPASTGRLQRATAVSFHYELLKVMQNLWKDSDFEFAGNFTEGWGYSIFRADGRPGSDSLLLWKHLLPTYTVHLRCCCTCPGVPDSRLADVKQDGTVLLAEDCVQLLRELRLARSEATLMTDGERQQMRQLSATGSSPQLQLQHALRCCRSPLLASFAASPLRVDDGDLQQQPVLVLLSEQELPADSRKAFRPLGWLDTSLLERRLLRGLSDRQGLVLCALKLLLLHSLRAESPYTERHCVHLLLQLLQQRPACVGASCDPTAAAKEALDLLLLQPRKSTAAGTLLRGSQRKPQQQLPPFPPPVPLLVDAASLRQLQASAAQLLQPLLLQFKAEQPPIFFHPHSLMIPGHSSLPLRLAYRDVPNCLFSIFRLLLAPENFDQAQTAELVERVAPRAPLAAVCLRCLLALKVGDLKAAKDSLYDCRSAADRVNRLFPRNSTAASIQNTLDSRDCSWLFRARLAVQEQQRVDARCARPLGTSFLAKYPKLRFLFFPAQFTALQHTDGCYVEYSLNISFLALAHALVVEVVQAPPSKTSLWRLMEEKQPLEAQELLWLSLADEYSQQQEEEAPEDQAERLGRLQELLEDRLRHSAASAPERQWLPHLRLRLAHAAILQLERRPDWGVNELQGCERLLLLLPQSAAGHREIRQKLQRQQLPPAETRKLLLQIKILHTKEIKAAYGVRRTDHAGGLARHFLPVHLFAFHCFDSSRSSEFRGVFEKDFSAP